MSPPECSTLAASSTAAAEKPGCCFGAGICAISPASFQAVSAGRIRVAICGGEPLAAAIAAAPSAETDLASGDVLTHSDIGRASPSMSEVSGAFRAMW